MGMRRCAEPATLGVGGTLTSSHPRPVLRIVPSGFGLGVRVRANLTLTLTLTLTLALTLTLTLT